MQKNIDALTGLELDAKDAVLDHDHRTQNVRGVIHRQMNVMLGRIERSYTRDMQWWCKIPLSKVLRMSANYLEKDYSENPFHPKWINKSCTLFTKLPAEGQTFVLKAFGLEPQSNGTKRKAVFQQLLKGGAVKFSEVLSEIEHAGLLSADKEKQIAKSTNTSTAAV